VEGKPTSERPIGRAGDTDAAGSPGAGTPDYVLVDDKGRGKLGRGDAPHLHYRSEWDAAGDLAVRHEVLKAAQAELEHIRRSHADRGAGESRQDRDRRIVNEGDGWPAREVANSFRCGITDVHKARAAAGRDIEYGRRPRNGRELSRAELNAEILRLHRQGLSQDSIANALNIVRNSVRYVLARPGPKTQPAERGQ
jgi:hypothetical protein